MILSLFVNGELEMPCKTFSSGYFTVLSQRLLRLSEETHENLSQFRRLSCRNLKLGLSEYEVGVLTTPSQCSVTVTHGSLIEEGTKCQEELFFGHVTRHSLSALLQPARPDDSGHTHVPWYSSKCSPGVQGTSVDSPSMQL
jgi:hypothetical protein